MLAASLRAGQADRALMATIERATKEAEVVHPIDLGPLTRSDARTLIASIGGAEREGSMRPVGATRSTCSNSPS